MWGLTCHGPVRIGGSLRAGCTILGTNYLFVGRCLNQPLSVPPALVCGNTAGCTFVVDPLLHVALVYHVVALLPIPNDPGLIGLTLCAQCASPWCIGGLSVFEGATVTIQP